MCIVPQESVVDPLLFVIYDDDLVEKVHGLVNNYADDTKQVDSEFIETGWYGSYMGLGYYSQQKSRAKGVGATGSMEVAGRREWKLYF